jgi:hypothetical protein
MQGCEQFLRGLLQQMMKSCLGYFQATTLSSEMYPFFERRVQGLLCGQ